ncbi:hypothetical protein [Swaminathania salitolerans]|uniref:Uncharacterized protein n=1 Tax=Swaminathania salitolerans TaxID=182838 RepID=A0A511BNN5_9PROT|nr:hypothetical protein [Swaminathania salitolerans]GBQ14718.1 hypothetical protein AA21291_1934 [Swaminathania salitolerans LMG 21291]GEL01865.1 hypothetical protein SSA02_10280 [Swaminathania salitolerans]
MARLGAYPRIATLDGSEVVVVEQQGCTRTLALKDLAPALPDQASSGVFFADDGARIGRIGDRLLVGAAADNQGLRDRDTTQNDWLSSLMGSTSIGAWATWTSTFSAISRFGATGIMGASRTSDSQNESGYMGFVPSAIGVAAWGVADETQSPTTATAYAYYGEAWRMPGVNYQPSFCMELETVNMGGPAWGVTTPFHPNCGGGTYAIQIGSGGGQTEGASDAEAGIVFVRNPARHRSGIVFASDSLTGTDGTDGYGTAIAMATRQGIEWRTGETHENVQGLDSGAMVFSTVSRSENGQRLQFSDDGVLITNMAGQLLFSVSPHTAPNNTLNIQAGSGQAAAGLYVQKGENGSANLGLYPGPGGELQIASPVTGQGARLSLNDQPAMWLHINVNGKSLRLPLFTPEQAGG